MSNLIAKARSYAKHVHEGQFRSGRMNTPFYSHIEEVATLVTSAESSIEEIAAAWLHDSIEDTDTTTEDIERDFNIEVATIVEGLTDPLDFEDIPLLERKLLQAERIRHKSKSVKKIKIADQTSNLRSIVTDPPQQNGVRRNVLTTSTVRALL